MTRDQKSAPFETVAFRDDWRGGPINILGAAFPGVEQPNARIRADLVNAIARAQTPGAAARDVSDRASKYSLEPPQQQAVTNVVVDLNVLQRRLDRESGGDA